MKNVIVRALSGTVYIVVFVLCIVLGKDWFFGLTVALTVIGITEYLRLESARLGERIDSTTYCLTYIMSVSLCSVSYIGMNPSLTAGCGMLTTAIALFVLATLCILSRGVISSSAHALPIAAQTILGVFYIALPMGLLNAAYVMGINSTGSTLILLSLICIWINDTGAFCVGSRIGRRRLCERLSPKKSWEGFWGGLILVVVAIAVYAVIEGQNILLYAFYGSLISVFATIGDLFESLLKRTAGVKDSGKLIPGHGGILDRIDSFLFVSYLIFIFALIKNCA